MTRTGRSLRTAALAFLGLALPPGAALGQLPVVDTAGYWHLGERVELLVHLDSLTAVPLPDADSAAVDAFLVAQGLMPIRRMPGGSAVTALSPPASSPASILQRARILRDQAPSLLINAGPLARAAGESDPIVLLGDVLVRFQANASEAAIESMAAAHGVEEFHVSSLDERLRLLRTTDASPGDVLSVAEAYAGSPVTRWAYPDFAESSRPTGPGRTARAPPPVPSAPALEIIPGGTHFSQQWHLKNGSGAVGDINATHAWDVTQGDPGVVIAIVETNGFDPTHPDLQPNLWENPHEKGGAPGADDGDPGDFVDDLHGWNFTLCAKVPGPACGDAVLTDSYSQHGTAVAGLAAAPNNSIGVTGVCPACRMMLLKVGALFDPSSLAHIEALLYADAMGASVVNLSLDPKYPGPLVPEVQSLAAKGRGGKGLPVIHAVDNQTKNVCGTGELDAATEVVSVGSSDNLDQRVDPGGMGPCLDLLAPGGFQQAGQQSRWGITSTDRPGAAGYNSMGIHSGCQRAEPKDTDYTNCMGGNSAAAPQVSGVVGLMLSVNPSLSLAEIEEILVTTAEKIDCASALYGGSPGCPSKGLAFSQTHGYGRLDAQAAVEAAEDSLPVAATGGGAGPVELGARAGWTDISGGSDPSIKNAPGGGPGGEPVFHVGWFPGTTLGGLSWMLELQVGTSLISTSSPPGDTKNTVLAVQPAFLFLLGFGQLYVGPSFAYQHLSGAGPTTNDTAWGLALGYRYLPIPHLALRAEARYRYWTSRKLDEVGLAAGFGVMIP